MGSELSATSVVGYKGVFNHTIYDLSDCRDNTEAGLIKHLLFKKTARLRKVLLDKVQRRIDEYRTIINDANWFNSLGNFGGSIVGSVADFFLGPKSIISETFKPDPKISVEDAKNKVFELLQAIQLLEKGLEDESISDLEVTYIKKKSSIKSKALQLEIEKSLLLAREESVPLDLLKKFIENALALPDTHLTIEADLFESKIKNDAFFKNFDKELLESFEQIINKMYVDSHDKDKSSNHRNTYYFYGEPGCGKSQAAKKIASILGLPYFVLPIRSLQDLSKENIEGAERNYASDNPGMLVNALMRKGKKGPALNGILILDDFDRVLLANGNNIPTTEALAFSLNYFDPKKKSFYCPYFKCFIDTSRLTIIVTANHPLPEPPQNGQMDPFAAIRSRANPIHFKGFPKNSLKEMLNPTAEKLANKYQLGLIFTPLRKAAFIERAMDKQKASSLEPRSLTKSLENIINEFSCNYHRKIKLDATSNGEHNKEELNLGEDNHKRKSFEGDDLNEGDEPQSKKAKTCGSSTHNTIPNTLADGNCSVNAVVLGFCELVKQNKISAAAYELIGNQFSTGPNRDVSLLTWLSDKNDIQKQQQLAPLFRKIAIDHIIKNYRIYAETYENGLSQAFDLFKNGHANEDLIFNVHTHIANAFNKLHRDELVQWWRREGGIKYFNNIKQSASSALDIEKWLGENEIDALAYCLEITIKNQKNNLTQILGIGYGLISELTPAQMKQLEALNIGFPYKQKFRIECNKSAVTEILNRAGTTITTELKKRVLDAVLENPPSFDIKHEMNHWSYLGISQETHKEQIERQYSASSSSSSSSTATAATAAPTTATVSASSSSSSSKPSK